VGVRSFFLRDSGCRVWCRWCLGWGEDVVPECRLILRVSGCFEGAIVYGFAGLGVYIDGRSDDIELAFSQSIC
jgi:hypothetical protein